MGEKGPHRFDTLRDEHCHVTSVDVCGFCGDSECDGIGCIASLDPNDERDHGPMEELHDLLRAGQAWRAMQAVLRTEEPVVAVMLAEEALAYAENRGPTDA